MIGFCANETTTDLWKIKKIEIFIGTESRPLSWVVQEMALTCISLNIRPCVSHRHGGKDELTDMADALSRNHLKARYPRRNCGPRTLKLAHRCQKPMYEEYNLAVRNRTKKGNQAPLGKTVTPGMAADKKRIKKTKRIGDSIRTRSRRSY